VVLKNASGKGSILDYLRTASQVAPSILPDVVMLNTVDLASAARAGLVVPLDDLISPNLSNDLLPAARAAGSVDGQLMGIPFEMDVAHLIYNTNKVASPPITWTDVISANTTYLFPAKGQNGLVNDAFLTQYLALGGQLQDDEGRPFLDEQPLRTVLDYYHQGLQAGVIPPDVLEINDADEIWPLYVSAQVGIAHVNSHRFLSDRNVLRSTQFANIPTLDGTPLTISHGWALAIVTGDPAQQAMALHLIEWLMTPDNNATWNRTTAHLPTRYAAFNLDGDSDPYWSFLQHQLEIAVPQPAFPGYDQIGRVLQQAVVEVLTEEATPEEAAAAAVEAIIP
jgi:ABC-type glycerol-3-phosphate transport system substrate-binding protein